MEYHENSGLMLYKHRGYSPNLQRWLNRDPFEEIDGANLHSFVQNNPVDHFDA